MLKKIVISAFFIFTFYFNIFAVDIDFIKSKFNELYQSIDTIYSEMTIQNLSGSSGERVFCRYYFKKPNLFYKSLKSSHSENITVSNGEIIRVLFPEIDFYDDFVISELDEDTKRTVYQQNLIGNYIDFNYLLKEFNVSKINEKDNYYVLILNAREDNEIREIELKINSENLLPQEIIVVYTDIQGISTSKITFIDIEVNQDVDEGLFIIE